MVEKSKALEKLYYDYTHLPLGGKFVRCPYWSNRQRILLSGPFKGKGTPRQITLATIKAAREHRLDLSKLSTSDIRKFMEHHRVGVDCSGFVYHLADAFDREKGGLGICEKVKGVRGSWVRRVNAFCLTNDVNSVEIKKVKEIRVGDLIRFNAGKHIALVLRVKKDPQDLPKEVTYAHSGRLSAITGVHTARFEVKNAQAGLDEQKWFEKTRKGYDFMKASFSQKEGDGLRRLKIWN